MTKKIPQCPQWTLRYWHFLTAQKATKRLFDFGFFEYNVFTHFWVKLFDFHFFWHRAFIFSRGIEITCTCSWNQFDFISHDEFPYLQIKFFRLWHANPPTLSQCLAYQWCAYLWMTHANAQSGFLTPPKNGGYVSLAKNGDGFCCLHEKHYCPPLGAFQLLDKLWTWCTPKKIMIQAQILSSI